MKYGKLAAIVGALLLTACSGGSSDSSNQSSEQTPPQAEAPSASTPPASSTRESESIAEFDALGDLPEDAAPKGFYTRDAEFPYITTKPMQYITLSNGKKLALYVTYPANKRGVPAEGKFPVLLVQTAYNINLVGIQRAMGGILLGAPDPYLVKRGYIQVSVDALGTGSSQGGWELLGAGEQQGYAEAVDWIKEQPWYNGKIGVAGASYMAISSLFTAQHRPDDIQAIIASVPMGDAQRGTVGIGGMLNGVFMSNWMTLTQITTVVNAAAVLRNPRLANEITAATQEHTDRIDDYYLPLVNDALTGAPYLTYDNEFWRVRSPLENIDKVKAPTMIFGALDDIFQRDEPQLYERLKKNVDARLVVYRGDHMSNFVQGFVGVDQVLPLPFRALQWFDKHLKGMDTHVEDIPPVAQYVKNSGTRFPTGFDFPGDWPHPQLTPERWFLHGDLTVSKTAPASVEASQSMAAAPAPDISYGKSKDGSSLIFHLTLNDGSKCSPSFRQWSLGGNVLDPMSCRYGTNKVEANALNYESAVLDADYYINGPIQADIWMESSAHEAVLSVRIDEVSKNGKKTVPLTNGMLLASARAVDESRSRFIKGEMIQPFHPFTEAAEQPVVPGQVMKMQVEVFPTSAILRKGHKLRISIAPSNDAQGILNLPRQALAAGGVSKIHVSPQYPSSVVLPMVPLDSAVPQ
ncbi:Hypothetical protein HDN1F_24680 [gamma proteobacterium HdN1]|nr:Hypothetical protein HDN1F_24680 [gamma proteobacterium HdN1]